MPTYDAKCTLCGWEHEFVSLINERDIVPACPRCGHTSERFIGQAPNIRPDLNDFSNENRGKGRYNKQLQSYVTSVNDATSKAAKRGWGVLDKA